MRGNRPTLKGRPRPCSTLPVVRGSIKAVHIHEIDAGLRDLHARLLVLLHEPAEPPLWEARMRALQARLAEWTLAHPDAVLFALLHAAARTLERYSSHHALVCCALAECCADALQWPAHERQALGLAALTMNIAMTSLQDELSFRERTPTLDQRRAIDTHPQRGADQLRAAGVEDELWLAVVASHHQALPPDVRAHAAPPARVADLLHRIDVFSAKMSPRQARRGLPPALAVRSVLGEGAAAPDPAAAALIKAAGIFPLGSYVKLANGETGIVVRRGRRADQPVVAAFRAGDRRALPAPVRRDTAEEPFRVAAVARAEEAGAHPDSQLLFAVGAAA